MNEETAMTQLLEQAVAEMKKLPEDVQDAIASRLLAEMEDERAWNEQFASTSDREWDRLASMVRKDISDGTTLPIEEILPGQPAQP
jgi:hypothetical protein